MATDNKAVANQKVFIALTDVMTVQADYLRLFKEIKTGQPTTSQLQYVRGMGHVIRALGLPIDTPSNI